MAAASATPLVSINMPVYRQLAHARRAVDTILAQSFTDFHLTLWDDGQSDDYREFVDALHDPRVSYCRHPERLGAMRNMFHAIGAGDGKYTLAFHEDDLVGVDYLATAVGLLERDPSCGFVAGELREFREEPAAAILAKRIDRPAYVTFSSRADFVRGILGGIEPMFGSIVYRRTAIAGLQPAHEDYGTLVDRPFLISILERWSAIVVREPLVWYRRHNTGDRRHHGMSADHIVRLMTMYRAALPSPLSDADRALFYTYSGYWLFTLYALTPEPQRPSLLSFLLRVWREGLYEPRWRGRFGLRLLTKALVGSDLRPPA